MVPDVSQLDLKAPKPRPWYRRRGWQVLLLLLAIFLGWFTWAIIEINETTALYLRLEEDRNCYVSFSNPEWTSKISDYQWFPESLSKWLKQRFRYPYEIRFSPSAKTPVNAALVESISKRNWPELLSFECKGLKLWDGQRLLVPLHCPELTVLGLKDAGIDDVALSHILPCYPKLEILSISNNPVKELGRNLICSRLSSLDLENTLIDVGSLVNLQYCQRLSSLNLPHTPITDESLKQLPSIPSLGQISLAGTGITGSTLFEHGVPSDLHTLNLAQTQVQVKHLSNLKGHQNLGTLDLSGTLNGDEDMQFLVTLPSLWELNLDNTAVSDQGVRALLATSKVTNRYLGHTRITNASGPVFRKSETLGQLYLGHTAIENDCIAALNGHPKLWILSVEGTKVNDQSLPYLLNMPSLKKVIVNKDQLSPASIKKLSERKVYVDVLEERDKRK